MSKSARTTKASFVYENTSQSPAGGGCAQPGVAVAVEDRGWPSGAQDTAERQMRGAVRGWGLQLDSCGFLSVWVAFAGRLEEEGVR